MDIISIEKSNKTTKMNLFSLYLLIIAINTANKTIVKNTRGIKACLKKKVKR